jgi:hypothetical protein
MAKSLSCAESAYKERLEITEWAINNDMNYKQAVDK